MNQQVYAKKPLTFHGAIPVFSTPNEYTGNYEQISGDHLEAMERDGTSNPWIIEDLWSQFENSTIALIQQYSQPCDRILDVGVGLGRLLSHFPNLQRYGMDISFGYLEVAQTKGIEVCYALIEDMPYKEGIFDIVVSTDVLEHVLDLNLSVAKILSVLREGGTLIVRVPYREDLSNYLEPTYPYRYAHIRNFDEYSSRLLFERVFGCEVVETVTAGYAPSGNRLKYPFPFPKRDNICVRLLSAVKVIHTPLYKALLRKLYYPIEINVVVKKRAMLDLIR